jgi:Homeodomain-like domain-containing protein
MKPPMSVRAFTPEERRQLTAGRRSSNAFTRRRCHILLASARGQRPATIARHLGYATQSGRNAIHAFDTQGLASLHAQSCRAQCPRTFGKPRSTWSFAVAAEVCWEQGLTLYPVNLENIRQALKRLGVRWQRAKSWLTSPDPP